MTSPYHQLTHWVTSQQLSAEDLPLALHQTEIWPSPQSWYRFISNSLLWLGFSFLACGLVFFFAYNWEAIGKFGKFALAAAFVLGALLVVLWQGVDNIAGQSALFAAGVGLGALLALIGQTYQTGTDPFELFVLWAIMLLPLALLGQNTAMWLLWITVSNLGLTLYVSTIPLGFSTFRGAIGFSSQPELWCGFLFNTGLLLAWELGRHYQKFGLDGRLGPRSLAVLSGGCICLLGLVHDGIGLWLAILWLPLFFSVYRFLLLDLFMLAGAVLAAITFGLRLIGEPVLRSGGTGGFLLLALFVIGISMISVQWLRQLAKENA